MSDRESDERVPGATEPPPPEQSLVYPEVASPSAAVQATMGEMNERLQTVIYAAERAADAIRFDAEAQAREHLAQAQQKADSLTAERVRLISDLTDDLIRHASLVRDHSEMMVNALEEAIRTVSGQLEDTLDQQAPPAPPPAAEAPPTPFAAPAVQAHEPAWAPYEPPPYVPPESSLPPEPAVESSSPPAPHYAPDPAPESAPPPPQPEPAPEPSVEPAREEAAALLATRLAVGGSDRPAIAQALRDELGITDPESVLDRVLGPA